MGRWQVIEEGGGQAEACVNAGNALCARAELADGAAALPDLEAAVQAYRTALTLEEDTEVCRFQTLLSLLLCCARYWNKRRGPLFCMVGAFPLDLFPTVPFSLLQRPSSMNRRGEEADGRETTPGERIETYTRSVA